MTAGLGAALDGTAVPRPLRRSSQAVMSVPLQPELTGQRGEGTLGSKSSGLCCCKVLLESMLWHQRGKR